MTECAARLVDEVLPRVPVRQWVLSLPYRLRYLLAWDHALARAVLGLSVRVLLGFQRHRARRSGIRDGRSGSVTVIQRFGGGLNLNIHFHTLLIDGVFFAKGGDGVLDFRPLAPPTDEEIGVVLARIATRVQRLLKRRGLDPGDGALVQADPVDRGISRARRHQPRLDPGANRARAPRRRARVAGGDDPDAPWVLSTAPRPAHLAGFDLHANVAVPAADRTRLEQLCRYLLRPAVAQDRLRRLDDGRIVLTLKAAWADGTRHLVFEPLTLLEKLAALTPRPRINLGLYHGVLAPHARWRARVTAHGAPPGQAPGTVSRSAHGDDDPAAVPPSRHWDHLQGACPRDVVDRRGASRRSRRLGREPAGREGRHRPGHPALTDAHAMNRLARPSGAGRRRRPHSHAASAEGRRRARTIEEGTRLATSDRPAGSKRIDPTFASMRRPRRAPGIWALVLVVLVRRRRRCARRGRREF
ncbi:MAG: transposase [Candidatus Rokuibacteriota bacterium]